jgi:hypothetical protein
MTQFFNESEIRQIAFRANFNRDLAPFALVAVQFVETINDNSDGWPYWKAGYRAAGRFLEILNTLSMPSRVYDPTTSDIAQLKKAMVPMKSLLTKHNLPSLPSV